MTVAIFALPAIRMPKVLQSSSSGQPVHQAGSAAILTPGAEKSSRTLATSWEKSRPERVAATKSEMKNKELISPRLEA